VKDRDIYIYREREIEIERDRERDREIERDREREREIERETVVLFMPTLNRIYLGFTIFYYSTPCG
jgi:hypothetical protein